MDFTHESRLLGLDFFGYTFFTAVKKQNKNTALWLQSFGIRVTVDTGNNFIQLSLHASRFGLEKRGINQELYWLPLDVADN